ncbi:phage tail assembly chaperone [Pseudomonas sp. FP453]|uniref:phage tail assembly chaperone n=1 Tax=Pseudomonas sp. FP453 TaxID=2954094 RepID=UPI0027329E02|nr:phage tail assembly chaperone [Pseudomonas sp. FP453]WLH91542.1 phage tail assembly chaperone [Pseudomonas sp. FP453]
MRFYSPSTGCTYLPAIHGENIPSDAVEISDEVFLQVIANPERGKIRAHDDNGQPYLISAPVIEIDLAVVERLWRDAEIESAKWLRERHRDELEIGVNTTLTTEQFSELLLYVQSLRDWPQSPNFPNNQQRPVAPAWIANQTE